MISTFNSHPPKVHRCSWVDVNDIAYINYHDHEWGIPVHDDKLLFETLVLETFVAGLSWQCVLHKRQNFRQAFDDFNVAIISQYKDTKISSLLNNKNIIRHKGKIEATIKNAQVFQKIQSEWSSFNNYLWHWTNGMTVLSGGNETTSPLSDRIAKDLKKRGMKFTGSVTIFSYLCAIGVINAHQKTCYCKKEKQ